MFIAPLFAITKDQKLLKCFKAKNACFYIKMRDISMGAGDMHTYLCMKYFWKEMTSRI